MGVSFWKGTKSDNKRVLVSKMEGKDSMIQVIYLNDGKSRYVKSLDELVHPIVTNEQITEQEYKTLVLLNKLFLQVFNKHFIGKLDHLTINELKDCLDKLVEQEYL